MRLAIVAVFSFVAPLSHAAAAERWTVDRSTSKIDDSTNVVAMMPADDVAANRYGSPNQITAILQCIEGRTSFFLHFGDFYMSDLADRGVVTVRVDKYKAKQVPMQESTDHKALGLTGGPAIRAAKSMQGKSSLVIAAVPVNENRVEASFSLAGFDDAMAAVRSACSW